MAHYRRIEELIDMIAPPNDGRCRTFLRENEAIIRRSPGSAHNHQAWEGGYLEHIEDASNIAIAIYATMDTLRPLPFSLSDALLTLFLHDIEKPWKYVARVRIADDHDFRRKKVEQYGFSLTSEHWNALEYVHGEGSEHRKDRRLQGPLSAFIHICDTASARIWFDQPRDGDKWSCRSSHGAGD